MAMARELFKHLFKKPATLKYPFEKRESFRGLRGRPVWDMKLCVGCELCSQICPAGAVEMIGKGLEAEIKLYVDRCIFCAQCAEDCPVGAISMTEEYELANYDRGGMVVEFKRAESRKANPKNGKEKPGAHSVQ